LVVFGLPDAILQVDVVQLSLVESNIEHLLLRWFELGFLLFLDMCLDDVLLTLLNDFVFKHVFLLELLQPFVVFVNSCFNHFIRTIARVCFQLPPQLSNAIDPLDVNRMELCFL
jgi:hypothetical protein